MRKTIDKNKTVIFCSWVNNNPLCGFPKWCLMFLVWPAAETQEANTWTLMAHSNIQACLDRTHTWCRGCGTRRRICSCSKTLLHPLYFSLSLIIPRFLYGTSAELGVEYSTRFIPCSRMDLVNVQVMQLPLSSNPNWSCALHSMFLDVLKWQVPAGSPLNSLTLVIN